MRLVALSLVTVLASAWALPAGAQTPRIALQEDDPIAGVGLLRFIDKLYVTDLGERLTEILPQGSNPSRALLVNGSPIRVEGAPVVEPGGTIRSWQSIMASAAGNVALVMTLEDPPGGSAADSGVYWNESLLALEGDPLVDPTVPAGLPPLGAGTTYERFRLARINASDSVLVLGEINDPTIGTAFDREQAIFRIDTDGMGGVTGLEVLVKEGDPDLVNGAWTVIGSSTLPGSLDFNDENEWIGQLGVTGGLTANTVIVVNGVQVAREGDPAPVPGRVWSDLVNPAVSINNFGDWAFRAQLNRVSPTAPEDRDTIVKNGRVFVRQLDALPSLAPYQVDDLGAAPVVLADSGDVFWYASTTNPVRAQDTVYMRNHDVLIQEGVTVVDGAVVTRLLATLWAFSVSPSGRFWIGEVDLEGRETLLLFDFGSVIPVPGCAGTNPATLKKVTGDPILGNTVTFEMDGGRGVALLAFSTAPAVPGSPCGIPVAFGEILIGLGPGSVVGARIGASPGGSPVRLRLAIPPDPSLVDLKLWGQGAFGLVGRTGGQTVALTNGIVIEIGAP